MVAAAAAASCATAAAAAAPPPPRSGLSYLALPPPPRAPRVMNLLSGRSEVGEEVWKSQTEQSGVGAGGDSEDRGRWWRFRVPTYRGINE